MGSVESSLDNVIFLISVKNLSGTNDTLRITRSGLHGSRGGNLVVFSFSIGKGVGH